MTFIVTDLAEGAHGLGDSLDLQIAKIIAGGRSEKIITETRQILATAGLMRGMSPDDIAQALFTEQKGRVAFVPDPDQDELIIDAETLLCLKDNGKCSPGGDCDDQNVVLGSRLRSVGLPVQVAVGLPRVGNQAHVWIGYDADWAQGGRWHYIDPSEADGRVRLEAFSEVITFDVRDFDRTGSKLISMGQPPSHTASRTGDPQPGMTALPADEQTAWTALLAKAGSDLDASLAKLTDWSTRYARIRSELGLPVFDASPATAPDGGPLVAYAAGGPWTKEAGAAESKMLQAGAMMSAAIAGGLSGQRALYWNAGDLFVAAAPGDAYAVLLKPNAAGQMVPAYIDLSTGGQTNTTGNPILIGVAIVVCSIAAAYAFNEVMGYMSQSHRDDAMGKVAEQQQALVASGKATPDQAAAFLKAATDLASAPGPSAAANPEWPWGKLIGAGGIGIAAGVLLSALFSRFFGASSSSRFGLVPA